MENINRKDHWERIYHKRASAELSWYQPLPITSLTFVKQLQLPYSAKIIDIGGGDSYLVDHLIGMGYLNVTVLDISVKAIERAKQRLGYNQSEVRWLNADAAHFHPPDKYDLWHDRATFHFLTAENEIKNYIATAISSIKPEGYLVIGTFSENGPEKCSGIRITRYSEKKMTGLLTDHFSKIKCITTDHITPTGTIQNFLFCCYKRSGVT
jgi:SAM-dependent methyltransferase